MKTIPAVLGMGAMFSVATMALAAETPQTPKAPKAPVVSATPAPAPEPVHTS